MDFAGFIDRYKTILLISLGVLFALLLLVNALAYYGVIDKTFFAAPRCDFGELFPCTDYGIIYHSVEDTVDVIFSMKNDFGEPIYVFGHITELGTEHGQIAGAGCTIKIVNGDGSEVTDLGDGSGTPVAEKEKFTIVATGCTQLGDVTTRHKHKQTIGFYYYPAAKDSMYSTKTDGYVMIKPKMI